LVKLVLSEFAPDFDFIKCLRLVSKRSVFYEKLVFGFNNIIIITRSKPKIADPFFI
jgi:hypothetical protein